eukprot:TRINITY_DN27708_c0_g1_i1.p1 TRINITY_DN27708_c0_g1~~TRINITY_DN27708_c0_g1_i1.p1  ORF type:complete len:431 (-),score=23.84 TRINITY_DN27708_c0_g1_i1:96-1388(-)
MIDFDEGGSCVIDFGAHTIKAGFAGSREPQTVQPTCLGVLPGATPEERRLYMGTNEIRQARDNMEIHSPFVHGNLEKDVTSPKIQHWDLWEAHIRRILNKVLNVSPKEHPLLLAEPSFVDPQQREKITQLCFEALDCQAVYMVKSPVLSTFSFGRSTACVFECGHSASSVTPVHEGFALTKPVIWSPQAGNHLSMQIYDYLQTLDNPLRPRHSFSKKRLQRDSDKWDIVENSAKVHNSFRKYTVYEDIIQDLKESTFKVSESEFQESTPIPKQPYELPDGSTINLAAQRYSIPEEIFFGPSSSSAIPPQQPQPHIPTPLTPKPVPDMIRDCIAQCDQDIRRELFSNIVASGGSTLLQGFTKRLEKELTARGPPPALKLRPIVAPQSRDERRFGVWIGGAILASLGSFQQLWISKADYAEVGASVVHRKCP